MNNMEIFNNAEFGSVRIKEENGSFLFCASDVAKALGYSNIHGTIKRHCRGVLKRYTPTSSGVQEISFIPEGDVYRLIVHSKLPSAERFERWVFDEVLPALRKNGIYITDPLVKKIAANPEYINAMWATLYKQGDKIKAQGQEIEERNDLINKQGALIDAQKKVIKEQDYLIYMQDVELCEQDMEIEDMGWKAEYYDNHVAESDGVPVRVLAKQLEMPERKLVDILIGCRFLYRCGKHLLPYADARNAGLFKVREGGTLVTPKGKDKIFKLLGALRLDSEAAV